MTEHLSYSEREQRQIGRQFVSFLYRESLTEPS